MARYVRYQQGDTAAYGSLEGTTIHPLDGIFGEFAPSSRPSIPLDAVRLLAPTVPSKIIAIGPNYRAHPGHEAVPLMMWTKPASCLNDPEGVIELPPGHPAVNHEAELAIVIGKRAKQVSRMSAADYIFGFTIMNDVTLGDFSTPEAFGRSPYFVHGKICDGFAPLGPCIVTDLDISNLRLQCRVNGHIRQDHSTSDRIHEPADLVATVSNYVTLFPGDVISTGSPPGVQPMRDGDVVEIEIENIGILRNYARNRV
jgi:2-keto-4-pentenoate hydratase/2-oxohepta-3-ene-1,7-dioic acid hydratase in catechol pathway